jgi:predicted HTH domain antitoxin
MQNTLHIQCPNELLLSLQLNVESFAEIVKLQTAIALFKQGKISSGLATKWLNMPRVNFLMQAMETGAELLENSEDDFMRETQLL